MTRDDDEATADAGDRQRRHDRRARAEQELASLGFDGALQGAARYSLLNIPEPVAGADADFDRAITLGEFRAAALARFQLLDSAHQGRLSLAELEALPHAPSSDRKHIKPSDDALDTRIGNPLPKGP